MKNHEPHRLTLDASAHERCRRWAEAERQFSIIAPRLTWTMLAALEPDLEALLHDARQADLFRTTSHFCAMTAWQTDLKPRLVALVGHCRPDFHPILATSSAYDLAYATLLKAVPPCDGCPCHG